jgi:PhnB protein
MQASVSPRLAPYFAVRDARGLAHFLVMGLGGRPTFEVRSPDGSLSHMEIQIEDSLIMLAESPVDQPPVPARLHLYVPDAKSAYERALLAGAVGIRAPAPAPDGAERGGARDLWGNEWWFTTLPKK